MVAAQFMNTALSSISSADRLTWWNRWRYDTVSGNGFKHMSTGTVILRDYDIRDLLLIWLRSQHLDDDSLILPELGLCEGKGRVDVGVVNGSITGYEIKSDRDTLSRLISQIEVYGLCLDQVILVTTDKHVGEALTLVPDWWGVMRVVTEGGCRTLARTRAPGVNPGVDPNAVIQLLWRAEAASLCHKYDIARKELRTQSRRNLWANLVNELTTEQVLDEVRTALKARGDWRADPPLFRCDEIHSTLPTQLHRQESHDWLLSLNTPDHPR
jgi:hypothetical protein